MTSSQLHLTPGTVTLLGRGITYVISETLDDAWKTCPIAVFKSKSGAANKAAAELAWCRKVELEEVEDVTVVERDSLFLVVYVYTDATAAERMTREAQQQQRTADALARKAARSG